MSDLDGTEHYLTLMNQLDINPADKRKNLKS